MHLKIPTVLWKWKTNYWCSFTFHMNFNLVEMSLKYGNSKPAEKSFDANVGCNNINYKLQFWNLFCYQENTIHTKYRIALSVMNSKNHTLSSEDISNGLMYSKPSNSVWSMVSSSFLSQNKIKIWSIVSSILLP